VWTTSVSLSDASVPILPLSNISRMKEIVFGINRSCCSRSAFQCRMVALVSRSLKRHSSMMRVFSFLRDRCVWWVHSIGSELSLLPSSSVCPSCRSGWTLVRANTPSYHMIIQIRWEDLLVTKSTGSSLQRQNPLSHARLKTTLNMWLRLRY
jgi:hypothetical protein